MPRDYIWLEVYWTLITHAKFHVNWLNTFENGERGGGGRIDLPPSMPLCNFFFFMPVKVNYFFFKKTL